MFQNMINVICGLFPRGLDEIVKALFVCFVIFSVAGVLTAVVAIVNHVRGLVGFGR